MTKKSPTALSMDYLAKAGWTVARVEHWNAHAGVRQDLFGIADLIAYKMGAYMQNGRIALIQTTSTSNMAARRKKILASPHYRGWRMAGGEIHVHGWGDNGFKEEIL